MTAAFDHILHWRLLAGSHAFPGPDGGTCINEAAVVAAGLPYRAIRGSQDCPPCFSRPLAAYALGLNDAMPDAERSRLMVFVLRLAGTADEPESEAARVRCLALESVRRLLPPLLDRVGLSALAAACEGARAETAKAAARRAAFEAGSRAEVAARRRAWRYGAEAAAAARAATAAAAAFDDPRCAAEVAEGAAPFLDETWDIAVDILDTAMDIGRQALVIAPEQARLRLDAARGAV